MELALKCDRRQISQTCLFTLPPIKYFDVFGDGLNGLDAGLEAPVMHQFIFEQSPEAFHGGVVVAVAPDHSALTNLRCYNRALSAISMYEMRRYLQHAQAVRPQKLVILAMNFRVFSTEPDQSGAFSEEQLIINSKGEKQFNFLSSRLPDMASPLISLPALLASLSTICKQAWVKDTLAADGYWKFMTNRFDHLAAFRTYTQNSAQRFIKLRQNENIFRKNTEELRLLLREAYGRGTDVKLLIPPSHAWHWLPLWLSGLWLRLENLKRQLMSRIMGVAEHDAPELAGFGVLLDGMGLERHLGSASHLAINHSDNVARIKALMDQTDKHVHE